jgi:short-subunit dehydrogenase
MPHHAFNGRSVIVTGASKGIGRATALALAEHGARLTLGARDAATLDIVARTCREAGAEALPVAMDVCDPASCETLAASARERYGGVDALILHAGAGVAARFDEEADLSVYERLMRVNYLGCVYPTKAALDDLKRSRGRIGVVASVAGLTGVPTRAGYAATKHALFGFFDSLRIELIDTGVTITMLPPDAVRSEHRGLGEAPGGEPGRAVMTEMECADRLLAALARRERLAVLSWRGRVGRWVRQFAPGLIDRAARRAVERGV